MKTNVMLKSTDRDLFGITIRQQTDESFLSINDLQKAYEKGRWQYGWGESRIANIMQTDKFQERVYHLLNERGFIKTDFTAFMRMVEIEGVTKVLKGLRVWKTTGRHDNKAVMCDPYIWILIAMEMNPLLYAKVVIWLTDSLVFDRLDAGNEFMPMNTAIKKVIETPNYPKYATAINMKVFGSHQVGMRNLASASQLKQITNIERFVMQSIEAGFIKTESEIVAAIDNYKA